MGTAGVSILESKFENPLALLHSEKAIAQEFLKTAETPSLKNENYKFTSLHDLKRDQQMKDLGAYSSLPKDFEGFSVLRPGSSDGATRIEENQSVHELFSAHFSETSWHAFGQFSSEKSILKDDFFAQMAIARSEKGFFVDHEKIASKKQIELGYYFDETSDSFYFRSFYFLGKDSELELTERFESSEGSEGMPLACACIQIFVSSGAKLHFNQLQNWGKNVHHYIRYEIFLEDSANVEFSGFQSGGKKGQQRIEVVCRGAGSVFNGQTVVYSSAKQHFDFWCRTSHPSHHTQGNFELWGVAADQSKIIFNGMIEIPSSGLNTESHQLSKNLLLSKRASVETMPKLEIATDDVKVSHGASVSSIDEMQLYYLQSRGISRVEAEAMIVDGFAEPVVSRFSNEKLKKELRSLWDAKTHKNKMQGDGL